MNTRDELIPLLRTLHKESLKDFVVGAFNEDEKYGKVLVVGSVGCGKTTFINRAKTDSIDLMMYEHFSLLEVTDIGKYNFIILFKNTNKIDNELCDSFGELYKLDQHEYIVIRNRKIIP